jgi:hypothetical protein
MFLTKENLPDMAATYIETRRFIISAGQKSLHSNTRFSFSYKNKPHFFLRIALAAGRFLRIAGHGLHREGRYPASPQACSDLHRHKSGARIQWLQRAHNQPFHKKHSKTYWIRTSGDAQKVPSRHIQKHPQKPEQLQSQVQKEMNTSFHHNNHMNGWI